MGHRLAPQAQADIDDIAYYVFVQSGSLETADRLIDSITTSIDGAEVPIYRTDVTLQGIIVPPGAHRVEFTMESRTLRTGLALSGAGVLLCVLLLVPW